MAVSLTGCLRTALFNPAASSTPVIVTAPTDATVREYLDEVSLSVEALGKNLTYQWYLDGQAIAGANSSQYTVTKARFSDHGSYRVIVTAAGGQTAEASATVDVQGTRPDWVRSVAGVPEESNLKSVTDHEGNVFQAFKYWSSDLQFSVASGTISTIANADTGNTSDTALAKYDRFGNLLWVRGLHGGDSQDILFIQPTSSGDVWVVGYTQARFEVFDPTAPSAPVVTVIPNSGAGIVLLKFSSAGEFLLARVMDTGGSIVGPYFEVGPEGEVFLGAAGAGALSLLAIDASGNHVEISTIPQTANNDFYWARFNADGDLTYSRAFQSGGHDDIANYKIDASGNFWLTLRHTGPPTISDDGGLVETLVSQGLGAETTILKVDAHGTLQWARNINTDISTPVSSMALDSAGNAYYCGARTGTPSIVDGVSGASLYTFAASAGFSDGYLLKLTAVGAIGYQVGFASAGLDGCQNVKVDSEGNAYAGGIFSAAGTIKNTAGVTVGNLNHIGNYDVFLAKISPAGALTFARSLGTTGANYNYNLLLDGEGGVYVTTTGFGNVQIFDETALAGVVGGWAAGATGELGLVRFNGNGAVVFSRVFTDQGGNVPTLKWTGDGRLFVGSTFQGDMSIRNPTSTIASVDFDESNAGGDVYFVFLNPDTGEVVRADSISLPGGFGGEMVEFSADASGNLAATVNAGSATVSYHGQSYPVAGWVTIGIGAAESR
ncbi:MAG: hypothetical protein AB7F66_14860 [Bacteriovoracia bacterium]